MDVKMQNKGIILWLWSFHQMIITINKTVRATWTLDKSFQCDVLLRPSRRSSFHPSPFVCKQDWDQTTAWITITINYSPWQHHPRYSVACCAPSPEKTRTNTSASSYVHCFSFRPNLEVKRIKITGSIPSSRRSPLTLPPPLRCTRWSFYWSRAEHVAPLTSEDQETNRLSCYK